MGSYGTCKTRKSTWQKVRRACLDLAQESNSIKSIAKKAGVDTVTIYKNKDLLAFVKNHVVSGYERRKEKTFARVRAACEALKAEGNEYISIASIAKKAGIDDYTIFHRKDLLEFAKKYADNRGSYQAMKSRARVRAACEALTAYGQELSVKSVAEEAGVHPHTIYRNKELSDYIKKYKADFNYQKVYTEGYRKGLADGLGSRQSNGLAPSEDWAKGVLGFTLKDSLTKEAVHARVAYLSKLYHLQNGLHEISRHLQIAYTILTRQ